MKVNFYFFLLISTISLSCIHTAPVQGNISEESYKPRKYDDDIVSKLKETKLVFFYGKETKGLMDSVKSAIELAWDIGPVLYDEFSNIGKYSEGHEYSFFSLIRQTIRSVSYTSKTIPGSSASVNDRHYVEINHYYLTLKLPFEGELCRIEQYPDKNTMLSNYDQSELHYRGHFHNRSPVFLLAQLKSVATSLKNNERLDLFGNIKNRDLLNELSNDTLYVSARNMLSFNPFSARERKKREGFFKAYKLPYRICNDDELFDLFVTKKKGRFLFEYVKSSRMKFLTIYDTKSGMLVYKKFSYGFNLKSSDLAKIK